MEEDIKILKEMKEIYRMQLNGLHKEICEIRMQAIKNILNRLEQDERVIEEMAEYIKNEWGFANKNEVIDHFRKKCE